MWEFLIMAIAICLFISGFAMMPIKWNIKQKICRFLGEKGHE